MYREFLRSRQPRHQSVYLPKEYFFFDGEGGSLPMITDELYQVIEMKVQLREYTITVDTFNSTYFGSNDSTKAL